MKEPSYICDGLMAEPPFRIMYEDYCRDQGITETSGAGYAYEAIDVAADSVGPNLDISDVDGNTFAAFHVLYIWTENLDIGNENVRGKLKKKGGVAFREAATSYRIASGNAAASSAADSNFIQLFDNTTSEGGMIEIWNIGIAAPTLFQSRDLDTSKTDPSYRTAFATDAEIEAEIRLYTSGGSTWNSGTLHVLGIRFAEVEVQTYAPSADTDFSFNVTDGHAIANLVLVDTTTSAAVKPVTRVGKGGEYQAASGEYRSGTFNDAASSSGDSTSLGTIGGASVTIDAAGFTSMYGLGRPCPVTAWSMEMGAGATSVTSTASRTTNLQAYDQVQVSVSSGNMTGGTAYLTSYNCSVTIQEHNFAIEGTATTHTFTGLNATPILVAVGEAFTMSNVDKIRVQAGDSGGIDVGASDYVEHTWNQTADDSAAASTMFAGPTSSGAQDFVNLYGGFGINNLTPILHMVHGQTIASGTTPVSNGGVRQATGVWDRLKFTTDFPRDISAGSLWSIGFVPGAVGSGAGLADPEAAFLTLVGDLFAGGEWGGAWMIRPGYIYQTTDTSTPADTDTDPIGRVTDLSGNAHHVIQATAGNRPLLDITGGIWSAVSASGKKLEATSLSTAHTGNVLFAAAAIRTPATSVNSGIVTVYKTGLNTYDNVFSGIVINYGDTANAIKPYRNFTPSGTTAIAVNQYRVVKGRFLTGNIGNSTVDDTTSGAASTTANFDADNIQIISGFTGRAQAAILLDRIPTTTEEREISRVLGLFQERAV